MTPMFLAYDATEHAARMVEGAKAAESDGRLEDAIADLEIALGAAEKAPRAIRDAIYELRLRAPIDHSKCAELRPDCMGCFPPF